MLDILEKIAKDNHPDKKLPSWVSDKNITMKAYNATLELIEEKRLYIKSHSNLSDYNIKKNYQISASNVARNISVATTTLISSSSYSKEFSNFLNEINKKLDNEKNAKLEKHHKTLSAGMKQRKKELILIELKSTREELNALRQKNAADQVTLIFNALPLPIKRKLGLNC